MMMSKTITLNQGEIHLWYASVKGHQKDIDRYQKLLSPSERQRVDNLCFKESRRTYTVCRGILREILSSYVGKSPQDLEIRKKDTGKPYLSNSRVQFNLSHSNDYMLCGITRGNPIGVDYQAVYKISNMDTLVRDFFSSQEKWLYDQFKKDDPSDFFFKTWVQKEAFMKATGLGFHLPSKHFSIRTANEGEPSLHFHRHYPFSDKEWSIRDIPVQPRFKAAFAVQGEIKDKKHFHHIL
jgi:4'-phosphopantetheinyl transferase